VAGWFRAKSLSPKLIVHESGQLSIWLQRSLERLGLPTICIDARKAHKSLSARPNNLMPLTLRVSLNWRSQAGSHLFTFEARIQICYGAWSARGRI
jgi:transposase